MTLFQAVPVSAASSSDFSVNNGTRYANVFGGVPNWFSNTAYLDSMRADGVNFMRRDVYLSQLLPSNITLQDYKSNVNNVQDPSTWDWSKYAWLDDYYSKGFNIMLIT